jgi:predicted permease
MFGLTGLLSRGDDIKRRGMMRFCMIFANNGFIGIPLAEAVLGHTHPVMRYLIVLNIVMNLTMFTLGAYLVSGDKKTMNLKKALLPAALTAALLAGSVSVPAQETQDVTMAFFRWNSYHRRNETW